MTDDDIVAGKGGFQKADLMDYGSLYGMGSYFGEDYTASTLVRLGTATRNNAALAMAGKVFAALPAEQQAAATAAMQRALQDIDLTKPEVVLPDSVADAVVTVRDEIAQVASISPIRRRAGPRPIASARNVARQTADFLVFSALTTVARRPGETWSWTENWPYEPLVGNTPTTNTFRWTWISFCFTFFAFGVVLFIYEFFLNNPDDAPMDPVLATFRPLTASQRRIGKYFLLVAALLLVQIAAGTIMAHSYYDRTSFYGIAINDFLPFNFLRDVHIQAPIVWIGLSWIGAALFLAPAIAGGQEAKGQHWLVDFLFLGDALDRRRRADRRLSRHHGRDRPELVLVRQPGPLLHPARPLLADRLLRRPCAVEPAGDAGAVAHRKALWRKAAGQFWSGRIRLEHLIWASTINIAVLYVFGMIPLTGHREILHADRFLALVGGPSLGRAVLRVLRRRHERLSADGGGPRLAQARRAGDLFRDHPDLPRRRHRHRPSPLLGGRPKHVGADGQHVLLHRGAAAGAADHRGDQPLPPHQGRIRSSNIGLPIPTSSARRSGISWARAYSAAARSTRRWSTTTSMAPS